MRRKRMLCATMAAIMTAAQIAIQLPVAAETVTATVFESAQIESWTSFDVNLSQYGIMDSGTSVKITCTVAEENIVGGDGETPKWAFGVVINGDWDHETMPHCNYDSARKEFSLTLTAQELSMNPSFTVQSQLPCAAAFTVEAIDLQQDGRGTIELPAVTGNIIMWQYTDSSWLAGSSCGGSLSIAQPDGVTFGRTTVGELRTGVKRINAQPVPYYSDSLGAGEDSWCYEVSLDLKNDAGETANIASDAFDLGSEGAVFTDNILPDDSYDAWTVEKISINVNAKTEWDDELGKSRAVSEKVRAMPDSTTAYFETSGSSGRDYTLAPITEKSTTMWTFTDDRGMRSAEGNVSVDAGDLAGITFADFLADCHTVSIAAPGYFSNDAGIDPDDLMYNINMVFQNGDGSDGRWLGRDLTPLTEGCTLYAGAYGDMLEEGTEDYTLTEITLRVLPKIERDENGAQQASSEIIRNMGDNESIFLEFAEDGREAAEVPVAQKSIIMNVWADDSWLTGVVASGRTERLDVHGVEYGRTTFAELKENIKSLSAALPYISDTAGAGSGAFEYKFMMTFGDGSEYFCETAAEPGAALTQRIDDINADEVNTGAITGIYIDVMSKLEESGDRQQAVSGVIRGLSSGNSFVLELAEDNRAEAGVTFTGKSAALNAWTDSSWLTGMVASGRTGRIAVDGIEYGATTLAQLKESTKSIRVTLPYYSDSIGAGREAFTYKLAFRFEDGAEYLCETNAVLGSELVQLVDGIDSSVSGAAITSVCFDIFSQTEETDGGLNQAVSEKIRQLKDGESVMVEFAKDGRAAVTVTVSDKSVEMNVWTTEDDWLTGVTAGGETSSVDVDGVKYGATTIAQLKENIKSLSAALPYCSDGAGAGREAFEYKFMIALAGGAEIWCETSAEIGSPLTQLTDAIEAEDENAVIKGIYLGISAKLEETDSGRMQAASEKIRALDADTAFEIVLKAASAVPENVKAQAGDGKVTLTWDKVEGAANYAVLMKKGAGWTVLGAAGNRTEYTVSGLTNGQKYYFAVKAYAGGAWGKASEAVAATPEKNIIPQNVKAQAGDGKVTLTWDKVEGAANYAVLMKKGAGWTVLGAAGNRTEYTVSGLTNGQKYYFAVKAYAGGAWGKASEAVAATPEKNIIPQNVKASAGDGKVTLTWDKVEGAANYAVFLRKGGTWLKIGTTGTGTAFTSRGLPNGGKYFYMIKSCVNGKWSGESAVVSAIPTCITPQNVKAFAGDGKVTLTWDAVKGASNYTIFLRKGSAWLKIGSSGANTTFTSRGLPNGGKYFYMVKAYVNGSWSDESAVVSAIPTSITPQNVKAAGGAGKAEISWDAVKGASNYAVFVKNGNSWKSLGSAGKATAYTAKGLAGGRYTFAVKAYVNGAWSDMSEAVTADVT